MQILTEKEVAGLERLSKEAKSYTPGGPIAPIYSAVMIELCESHELLRQQLEEAVKVIMWAAGKPLWGDPAEIKHWSDRAVALVKSIRQPQEPEVGA